MAVSHSEIRTYSFAESSGNPAGYALKALEDVYDQGNLESERPHRHDYYVLLYFVEASGTHTVDFHQYTLAGGTLYFLQPGQMHQLYFSGVPRGHAILFTNEFLMSHAIPARLIDELFLYNQEGETPPLQVPEDHRGAYDDLIRQMQFFANHTEKFNPEAFGSLVRLFLILGNNNCSLNRSENPQLQETGNTLLRSFRSLLDQHYDSLHQVADYADRMALSADYLNKSLRNLTGITAKEHIQNKIVLESKRLLTFSDLSNKELAFRLGFEEAAHFSHFFKKETGQTPGSFRSAIRSVR